MCSDPQPHRATLQSQLSSVPFPLQARWSIFEPHTQKKKQGAALRAARRISSQFIDATLCNLTFSCFLCTVHSVVRKRAGCQKHARTQGSVGNHETSQVVESCWKLYAIVCLFVFSQSPLSLEMNGRAPGYLLYTSREPEGINRILFLRSWVKVNKMRPAQRRSTNETFSIRVFLFSQFLSPSCTSFYTFFFLCQIDLLMSEMKWCIFSSQIPSTKLLVEPLLPLSYLNRWSCHCTFLHSSWEVWQPEARLFFLDVFTFFFFFFLRRILLETPTAVCVWESVCVWAPLPLLPFLTLLAVWSMPACLF